MVDGRHLANGAGYYAFVIQLIPAFVTELTGTAADAGVVMAILGLAAVVGPAVGRFADRHFAHRVVLSLGVLAMSLAFAAYALSAERTALYALEALLLGLGVARHVHRADLSCSQIALAVAKL